MTHAPANPHDLSGLPPTGKGARIAAPAAPDDALQVELSAVLHREVARAEVRIGKLRVAAFALASVLDTGFALSGTRGWNNLAGSLLPLIVSLVLLWALRKRHSEVVSGFGLPALDAVLICWLVAVRASESIEIVTIISGSLTLCCGVLAATGGMRFEARFATWSTLMSGIPYLYLMAVTDQGVTKYYGLLLLGVLGGLSFWNSRAAQASLRASRSQAMLKRFLPMEVLESAYGTSDVDLREGRLVDVTVLFTDLRGFTSWSEHREPAQVLRELSVLQGLLAREVHRAGGVVDKFLGDGMLAVFGLRGSDEGHAAQALGAIQSIRRAWAEHHATSSEAPFALGMGVHSGQVIAGCMGADERLEFTILGDTVNTASRLESLTKQYRTDVLLSEPTRTRAGVALEALDEVVIRGKSAPLRIYALPHDEA